MKTGIFDESPIKTNIIKTEAQNIHKNRKENTIEQKKESFKLWVKEHFDSLFNDQFNNYSDFFYEDPVHKKIQEFFPNEDKYYISKEKALFVKIFADELINFSENLIFRKDYSQEKNKIFYINLRKLYFGRSPDVLEFLKVDKFNQIITFSKINETYNLRNIVDTQGELTLDLSWASESNLKKFKKIIKNLNESDKISVIKQLSSTALWADGNGSWAYPAFIAIVQTIKEIKKEEVSPIVSFVLDFELNKIKTYSQDIDIFQDDKSLEKLKQERNETGMDVKHRVIKENIEFFSSNNIIPDLNNIYCSRVSKDYGSIMDSSNLMPFALVKNIDKRENPTSEFSDRDIKGLKLFLEHMQTKFDFDVQTFIDIADIYNFLKNKKIDLITNIPELNEELSESLLKIRREIVDILNNKNHNFHLQNWDSLEEQQQLATMSLESVFNEKVDYLVEIVKKIPLNELYSVINKIIEEDSKNKATLPIINYDGLTKNKEFNPLGSEDFSHLVKVLHSPEIRNYINKRLGIKIEDLYLREQIHFLHFLAESNEENFNRLENILQNKKEKINQEYLKLFISMSGDKAMGSIILSLGEKLPEGIAQKVFTKYGEIIDNVSKITEFTRTNFTKEIEISPKLIKKIEETLYVKGKQLLSQTYDDISNNKEINYENIEKQLDRINADTITTFAIFKQAVKNGEKLPIESIEGSVFSKKEAVDIPDNQQNEMLELYETNWKNHPDRNFVESLKSYFKTAFYPEDNKQKNYFYTFEKDNNIRAFVRFEKQKDASFYASALNVDEASKNFGLGEAMMDEALTREAKENILHASCLKDNISNMRYFEKGFISKGTKTTEGVEEFILVWDENKNKDIKAKQKTEEELINMYNNKNDEEIEIIKANDLSQLHENKINDKALVRCFVKNNEWYAVYEKVSEDYGVNLGETK